MAELNKGTLTAENNNSFPNNNTGFITPTLLRTFNGNMIDSMVDEISYNADSASFSSSISDLKNFSASLDNTYATDAQLNFSSSVLQGNINALSASVTVTVNSLSSSIAVTDLAQSSSIAALQVFSSSLDATFATDAQLSASASTLQNEINLKVNISETSSMTVLSSSYALSASHATNVPETASFAISASRAVSSSNALTASYLLGVIESASFAQTASFLLGSIASASFATSASYALSASYSSTASFAENAGNVDTSSLATTGSNTFVGNQIISGNLNVTGSLTASGLNYPTADNGEKSFLQTDGAGNLSLQYVETVYETIRNSEAVTINKGTPVYISGSTGDNGNAFIADASNVAKMPAIYIAGETLTAGQTGIAVALGLIEGVNTTGFAAGTEIYVAEGGGYSSSRPSGSSSVVQKLGVVTKEGVGGQGVVINQLEAELPNLEAGYLWVGNNTNQPVAISTGSFIQEIETGSFATTGSNTFIGNQIISGNLLVTGSNINLEVDAPALSVGVTNVKTVLDATASGVVSSTDITRLGAGPTGDLSGVRLQTLSGSDTTGDTLLSRIQTGVNRHTSTGMTGSVVNSTITSTWATGSGGTRVAYSTTINANAQSQSATLTLSAGNSSLNNVGGTASIAAGLIRIGTNAAHTISTTGSFGPMVIVGPLNQPVVSIRSGSFELTTPQGSGSFYSNVPITSSGLRINGTALVNDLIISGVFSGNSTLQVGANASVSGNLFVSGVADISSISASKGLSLTGSSPTIVSGNLSGSLVSTLTDTYASTPQATFIVTIDSASMATLLSGSTTNANTLYFVI